MADELSEGWKRIFAEPSPRQAGDIYISATNVRPIGPSDWPETWREEAVYGEGCFLTDTEEACE